MRRPHILVIPYPAQGHVLPLMSFSQYLATQGIQITFINTQFNHTRIMKSLLTDTSTNYVGDRIKLVSIPDGLEDSPENRKTPGKISDSVLHFMPAKVEEMIQRMMMMSGEMIDCVVADQSLGWATEIAKKFGIKTVAFCPAAAASLVLGLSIQKLIDDGIIDPDGTPRRDHETIKLSPGMPEMETSKFMWVSLKSEDSRRNIFRLLTRNIKSLQSIDRLLCNSVYELESAAFELGPKIFPVGPISLARGPNKKPISVGSFWAEDRSCLDWLDRQTSGSVIYVAFGSTGLMGQTQVQELAMGLVLTNRPFLWVTGGDQEAVMNLSESTRQCHVVKWAPQRAVLGHRAIGCFVSHCGWNSTMEGAAEGVPFLCWPYLGDQFINKTYICDVWKIGLGLERDERGMVGRWEVKKKVDEIMEEEGYRRRAREIKEIVRSSGGEGGTSYDNLKDFVVWIEEGMLI